MSSTLNGDQNCSGHARHILVPQNKQLLCYMTILRDRRSDNHQFVQATQKVGALLMDQALELVPTTSIDIQTPIEKAYLGTAFTENICGVSIWRAGASLEEALRQTYSGPLSFGKILIQRDEKTCEPVYLYSKFPASLTQGYVFILEPMLATGGSICKAIELLISRGVKQDRIVVINVMTSRRALTKVSNVYPEVSVVMAAVDENLTEKNYIDPGLGDFGDRFYGT